MGNAVVDLLLVRIGLGVGLADALRDDARVALGVAGVLAVLALHAGRVREELSAQGAAHDVVELLGDELVAVHLVDLLLALPDGALAVESDIERPTIRRLLREADGQVHRAAGLQREPGIDRLRGDLCRALHARPGGISEPSARASRRGGVLGGGRVHVELGRRGAGGGAARHPVRRNPARATDLGLDLLSSHFLDDVGDAHPQQSDRQGVVARLVVDGQLDLVGLVDVDVVVLGVPSIGPGALGTSDDVVFDLDGDEGVGAPGEAAGGGVVDILHGLDADRQLSGEGLPHVGRVDTVI